MNKKSLKMINVKYSENGFDLLKNIQITIPENQSMGIISNNSEEISAFKKILTSPRSHYGGYIFSYGNLIEKQKTKKGSNVLVDNTFDVFDFNFFNEKLVIDLFNHQVLLFAKTQNKITIAKANWEKAFLSNDKKTLDQEIEINLELIDKQKKIITNFSRKWHQKIKSVFNSFQLKKYKEFFVFLEKYEHERHQLYDEITLNFINSQNSIFDLYLDLEQVNNTQKTNQEVEKLSDILADGNAEIIQELQKEIIKVKTQITELRKKVEIQTTENKILWTKAFHDLSQEIDDYRRFLRINDSTTGQKIFWYKKVILLKSQFEKLKKNKEKISKLNSEQFIQMLQDYEFHNDNIIVDSFPHLSFSNKSRKTIASDIKQRNNFTFYTYELESIENEKATIKAIEKLEDYRLELEKKLSNKSLYNDKQIRRQKEEESLIQRQILADKNWDVNIRKTELTTIVVNIQKDKQGLLDSYNSICNWLSNADKKILSLIGKIDLIFSFFGKRDGIKIQNQRYRDNFKQYLEQDIYFSHLKTVNHFFENPSATTNLNYGLVLYSLSSIVEKLGFDIGLLWKRYKKLNQNEKLKVNLLLSQFLDKKIHLLDFENNQIEPEQKQLCQAMFKDKSVVVFDSLENLKEWKVDNMALITEGYILEQGSRKSFCSSTKHPYLKEYLKTKKWNSAKIAELDEIEFMSFNSRKIYHEIRPNHWVFGSATFLGLNDQEIKTKKVTKIKNIEG